MNEFANEELPSGWMIVSIGDLVHEKVNQAGPQPNHDFTYIDIGSIDNSRKQITEARSLPYSEAPSRAKQVVSCGDVLVSMTRPNLNAVAITQADMDGAIASTGFDVLRAKRAEPKWLFYAVQSSDFVRAMCQLVQGALYPAVRPRDIRAYRLPLPPINEQRRIAAKIEELFSDLDAGVAALERAKANLKRYRAAVLKAAVEGKLTEEWRAKHPKTESASKLLERILRERREKWEADQLAKFAAAGKAPPKNWKAKYVEPKPPDTTGLPELPAGWCWATLDAISTVLGGFAFQSKNFASDGFQVVKIANVRPGRLDLTRQPEFIREVAADILQKYELRECDILISLTGTRFKRDYGYTAVVGAERNLLVNQRVARVRPIETACSQFMQIATTAVQFQDYFFSQETGNVGQGNVGMDSLRNAPLPLCPIEEQQKIGAEVERIMSNLDVLDSNLITADIRANRLRQCILKKAFEGRLVPQYKNDESAAEWLARNGSAAEAQATVNKGRRGLRQKATIQS